MEEMILTNQYYVALDSDNRITMVTSTKQNEDMFLFDFPMDFDISQHIHYKIVDGELVHDEFVYPEVEPQPTEEQLRIAQLEEQLAMADEASIELFETVMAQEDVNTAQDEALIEIYEIIGG